MKAHLSLLLSNYLLEPEGSFSITEMSVVRLVNYSHKNALSKNSGVVPDMPFKVDLR